jgi:hypothetical protein
MSVQGRLSFTHIIDSHRKSGPSPLPAFVIFFSRGSRLEQLNIQYSLSVLWW